MGRTTLSPCCIYSFTRPSTSTAEGNLPIFQGFRNHKLHDVLKAPGTADLTADVDFSYLRKMAQGKIATLGPIKQREFLKNMGVDLRMQVQCFQAYNTLLIHKQCS